MRCDAIALVTAIYRRGYQLGNTDIWCKRNVSVSDANCKASHDATSETDAVLDARIAREYPFTYVVKRKPFEAQRKGKFDEVCTSALSHHDCRLLQPDLSRPRRAADMQRRSRLANEAAEIKRGYELEREMAEQKIVAPALDAAFDAVAAATLMSAAAAAELLEAQEVRNEGGREASRLFLTPRVCMGATGRKKNPGEGESLSSCAVAP